MCQVCVNTVRENMKGAIEVIGNRKLPLLEVRRKPAAAITTFGLEVGFEVEHSVKEAEVVSFYVAGNIFHVAEMEDGNVLIQDELEIVDRKNTVEWFLNRPEECFCYKCLLCSVIVEIYKEVKESADQTPQVVN